MRPGATQACSGKSRPPMNQNAALFIVVLSLKLATYLGFKTCLGCRISSSRAQQPSRLPNETPSTTACAWVTRNCAVVVRLSSLVRKNLLVYPYMGPVADTVGLLRLYQ